MKARFEGIKVKVVKNNYTSLNPWAIVEEPQGKLFSVFADKETALRAVEGFKLDLIEIIE